VPDVAREQLPPVRLPSGVELAAEVTSTAASRGAPPVVFLHGTTFSRGVWRPIADELAGLAAGIAVDLRGHGDSSNPEPPYHWSLFADDTVAFIEQLPPGPIVLCGHSLGGATAAEVAARIPERVAALVLIEPVLAPRGVAPSDGLIEATLRRKRSWPDQAQAEEHFAARSPWRYWDREVLAGFFATGLTRTQDGECTLSSPPEVAASVYAEALGSQAWSKLPHITCPVRVLRAAGDQGGRPSTASPLIAQTTPDGTDRLIDGPSGHFLPMEQPQLIAEFIRQTLTELPS
jgi:esterase